MQFKRLKVIESKGFLLAHNLQLNNRLLKKGTKLNTKLINLLIKENILVVYGFKKNLNDLDENSAAKKVASFLASNELYLDKPVNGRADIFSKVSGMLVIKRNELIKINKNFAEFAICSLKNYSLIKAGQLIGNVKVLPYAVAKNKINRLVQNKSSKSTFSVKSVKVKKIALILSIENNSRKILKVTDALEARLKYFGLSINITEKARHNVKNLTDSIKKVIEKDKIDLLLIYGNTSIVDRKDIIPYSIKKLGGQIISLGLPSDPGNLSLIANIRNTKIIGVPGCASSPKRNGFDIILERLCFDININATDLAEIAEGGLFKTMIKKSI